MEYYLYHICKLEDKDNYEKGYIGITKREPIVRWKEHRKSKNWYKENDDIIEYVIKKDTDQIIKKLEEELRPFPNMGWNTTAGNIELPRNHPAAKYARYGKKKKKK